MRKVIGGLLMFAVVAGGAWMMIGREGNISLSKEVQTKDAKREIVKIAEKLETYPSTPKEVIEIHNELMGICYKYPMNDEAIKSYVQTIRTMYTNELNRLNPETSQIAQIELEREQLNSQMQELVVSEILDTYISKGDSGKEESAEVNVKHVMNTGAVNRQYRLLNENNTWKINGWEDIQEYHNAEEEQK